MLGKFLKLSTKTKIIVIAALAAISILVSVIGNLVYNVHSKTLKAQYENNVREANEYYGAIADFWSD